MLLSPVLSLLCIYNPAQSSLKARFHTPCVCREPGFSFYSFLISMTGCLQVQYRETAPSLDNLTDDENGAPGNGAGLHMGSEMFFNAQPGGDTGALSNDEQHSEVEPEDIDDSPDEGLLLLLFSPPISYPVPIHNIINCSGSSKSAQCQGQSFLHMYPVSSLLQLTVSGALKWIHLCLERTYIP